MSILEGHFSKPAWEKYKQEELSGLIPILENAGYTLDAAQPHTEGERYLMQAVTTTSGPKLILLGTSPTGERVVIKATSSPGGMRELEHERLCRQALASIPFSYVPFVSPREVLFERRGKYLVSIQEFITQDTPFLARTLEEQFSFALSSFKAQESVHATTYEHIRTARRVFGSVGSAQYLRNFNTFQTATGADHTLLTKASEVLALEQETIEQYGNFLTHTDFVPHNFRIRDGAMYLLDHSSLRFGNKHEGWARFVNFMDLHNRPLARAITEYLSRNRSEEEQRSFFLMRIYRLGEIIAYYSRTLSRSEGALRTLNQGRIAFWSEMLRKHLSSESLSDAEVNDYILLRNRLRDPEENRRQEGLH